MSGRRVMDLVGRRFGALVATRLLTSRTPSGGVIWECACDCGLLTKVRATDLRIGNTKSCGCRATVVKHGDTRSAEYRTWERMKQRCHNPHYPRFHDWGGRGIEVCVRWRHDFVAFLADMGRRPVGFTSIDRIDNDGNYEPGNCRWATAKQQQGNTRRSIS